MRPDLQEELDALRDAGLWRSLKPRPGAGGVLEENGARILNFSSNDYLDLARHARLEMAAVRAVSKWGTGAGASRLMSGHFPLHDDLEEALARLCGQETALLFPTGFQANLGVITSLAGRDDVIYSDALNHASIIDGCRLSRATLRVYPHNDTAALRDLLAAEGPCRRRIIVTDSVFSMDGDCADVAALHAVAQEFDAWLVVDEAHAVGVFGNGGGVCRAVGITPDVTVGTLSKALGSGGGFAATSQPVRDLLINRARSFIYTTGLSPACVGSAHEAVRLIEDYPDLGANLLRNTRAFVTMLKDHGVETLPTDSQIVPIMVGDNTQAVALAEALQEDHILVTGIRPPTVPKGTARLRLSLTLAHTESDLRHAAQRIAAVLTPAIS
jgi:8-amino-7-oxononanoate synthase